MTIDDEKVMKFLEDGNNTHHIPTQSKKKRKRKIKYGNKGFINHKR